MTRPVLSIAVAVGLFLGLTISGQAHEAPRGIVSITLGSMVTDFQDKVDIGSAVPLGGAHFLMRAPFKPMPGFESGYVVYGNCMEKGRIVRIKAKYEQEDEEFYNRVLAALSKRYGKPTEWRGNPFGTLKIWKWTLKDATHHSIGIELQHYEGDDDAFTPGNSIKLTHGKFLEEEKACHKRNRKETKGAPATCSSGEKLDFEIYLPH